MISARVRSIAWLCVLVGAVLLGLDAWLRPSAALFAYLAAFGATAATMIGALALSAMTSTVSARWFVALRGFGTGMVSSTFLLPLLSLPIAFRLSTLYDWTRAAPGGAESADPHPTAFGIPWMGPTWFLIRSAIYLALWIAYAEFIQRAWRDQEAGRESWFTRTRAAVGAVTLLILGFSGTFAAFDWIMSAVPGWSMTGMGLYVLTGGFGAAVGFLALLVHGAKTRDLLPREVGGAHSLAIGRLLFASVCLWAYLAISQLVIVWIANLPREAAFCLSRTAGVFRYFAGILLFGHFIVPFFLLLSRSWKERSGFNAWMGGWLVLMQALDFYWMVMPSSHHSVSALDLGPFLLMGGLATVTVSARIARQGLVPRRDPGLPRSLGYESP